MSKHSKILEFGSKVNADNYIATGWELFETRAEPFVLGKTIIVYRVGWQTEAITLTRVNFALTIGNHKIVIKREAYRVRPTAMAQVRNPAGAT